jgi:L-methionine (R)-S-oxide reductase
MAESISIIGTTKEEKYQSLIPQINHLVEGEPDNLANIANIIAALKFSMNFFWVGIYFVKNNIANDKEELVLGPFQGSVACTRIAYGKGVCGKAWEVKETIIVDDVDAFPGHIACSSLSKSEIVVPITNRNGQVTMVLDIDSEVLSNFDDVDHFYLNKVGEIIASLNS